MGLERMVRGANIRTHERGDGRSPAPGLYRDVEAASPATFQYSRFAIGRCAAVVLLASTVSVLPAQGGVGEIACQESPGFFIDVQTTTQDDPFCYDFGTPQSPSIPPDFFGPGTDPFTGIVCMRGEPLGPTEFGIYAEADTLILRSDDPFDRCELPDPTERTVDIEIVALNLRSIDPITVSVGKDASPSFWDVFVDLSQNEVPLGSLTAIKTHCNGGTFSSVLNLQPRVTFIRVDDPTQTRELDTGLAGIEPVQLVRNGGTPWVLDTDLNTQQPFCTAFHPGIQDGNQSQDCDPDDDGVPSHSSCDNCPDVFNPDQLDSDDDGVGDACTEQCPVVCGDLDGDDDVDGGDFSRLLAAFGRSEGDLLFDTCADYDADGAITFVDYQSWLQCYRSFINDPGAPVPWLPQKGDYDADSDIDLVDFAYFQVCRSGPPQEFALPCLLNFDFDGNMAIDTADYAAFYEVAILGLPQE